MVTMRKVKGIESGIFNKSVEIADKILNHSSNLRDFLDGRSASQLYAERRPYIAEMVGHTGQFVFTPKSSYDALEEAKPLIEAELEKMASDYRKTPLNSSEGKEIESRYHLLRMLRSNLMNEDYLNNKVSKDIINASNQYTDNGKPYLSSPKLSRWLTKLVGESSPLVSWYTNKCPKGANILGERDEYELVISTLPHQIAGMSYYSPYNWGGKGWIDAWNYTSCMDTIRNGGGDTIYQLPPNLWDETLAVAYLRHTSPQLTPSEFDDMEEVFVARMLIRVVKVRGRYLIIGQRIYAENHDSKKLITEAMKIQFDNYVHADYFHNFNSRNKKVIYRQENNIASTFGRQECSRCDGDGYDEDGDTCYHCDGDGYLDGEARKPYNDNGNAMDFLDDGDIAFYIPEAFLDKIGWTADLQEAVGV